MSTQTDIYYLFLCSCVDAFLNHLDVSALPRSAPINKCAYHLWGLKSLTYDLTVYACPSCNHSLLGTDFNKFHSTLQVIGDVRGLCFNIRKKKKMLLLRLFGDKEEMTV